MVNRDLKSGLTKSIPTHQIKSCMIENLLILESLRKVY